VSKEISVSVLLPVKNAQLFAENSISDIFRNLGPCDEIIVLDDDSTDNTSFFYRDWEKRDPRVRFIKVQGHGIISALSQGLKEARFDWIARFDVDDRYPRYRLQEQRKLLAEGVAAVFSDYEFISARDEPLGVIPSAVFAPAVSVSLATANRTAHPSVIFNKKMALDAGGYREQDFLAEDLSLWLRISRSGRLVSVPKPLLKYRLHANSVSVKRRPEMLKASREVLNNIGVKRSDVNALLEDPVHFLNKYSGMYLEHSRQLLLVRDLAEACRLSKISNTRKKIELLTKYALKPESIRSLYNLERERRIRNKARKLQPGTSNSNPSLG
jgi:glycosyltransferase involved in cell wall biosynthesis